MKRAISLLLPLVILLVISATSATAAGLILLQGQLTDTLQVPINGPLTLTFTLYADAAKTHSVWTEEQVVNFNAGAFSVYLGQAQALDPSLFADSAIFYLGVKVGNDDELEPFPIAHTPRTLWAEQARDANTLQGLNPGDFLAADYTPDWSELSNIPVALLDAIDAGLERDVSDTNELIATVQLNGAQLDITEAGQTFSVDLSGLADGVVDPDADPTNELNTTVALNGTSLEITDSGGTLSADLSSLQGGNQDLAAVLTEGTDAGGADATNLGSVTATRFFSSDNTATGTDATAIGGTNNEALGSLAAILGGRDNIASGTESFIGGGDDNYANGADTVVAGGDRNRIAAEVTCDATNDQSVNVGCLGAGDAYFDGTVDYDLPRSCVSDNTLCYSKSSGSSSSAIGGGRSNHINSSSILSTISGGGENYIAANSDSNVISGGYLNTIGDFASRSVIGGGLANVIDDFQAVIGGGKENYVVGRESVVGGGANNYAAGIRSTIPGGDNNETGANYAFAAGRNAKALHQGAFVWGDSNGSDVASTTNNQFTARASGGFIFYTNTGASAGAQLTAGSGSWSSLSDRKRKENFADVDGGDVLKRVADLPVSTWNYKSQNKDIRHMGPTAQDFHAAFGLGDSQQLISAVDADGVCLASVQGLYHLSQKQTAVIEAQKEQIQALAKRLERLERLVNKTLE
jgi:hypothetical protein